MNELEGLREERDALAAHVEQTDTPATILIENMQEAIELLQAAGDAPNIVALTDTLGKAVDDLAGILNDNPETSLAKLKAQCQMEMLNEIIEYHEDVGVDYWTGFLCSKYENLRRQAEEH